MGRKEKLPPHDPIPDIAPCNYGAFELIKIIYRQGSAVGGLIPPFSASSATTFLPGRLTNAVQTIFGEMTPGRGPAEGVRATAFTPKPRIRQLEHRGRKPSPSAIEGNRKAYFKELGGYASTPVYDSNALLCGNEIDGPAILEEETTTIIVFPNSKVGVTKWGNYLME